MERRRYEREAYRKRRQRRQERLALCMSGVLLGAACMAGTVWGISGQNGWPVEAQDEVSAEAQDWQIHSQQGGEIAQEQDWETSDAQSASVPGENGAGFGQAADFGGLYSRKVQFTRDYTG